MVNNQRYRYYHERIKKTLAFIIPPNKRVLIIGIDGEKFSSQEKFDYIVLNGALGKSPDLMKLLKKIQSACHSSTRLIVYQYNYLWQKILAKQGVPNWLSVN